VLLAKLAIPLAMATVGAGAAAVAVVSEPASTTQVSTASQVWIDAPTGEEAVAPGEVHVGAHATAEGSMGSLVLYVDGKAAATDSDLERNEKLVYGSFNWPATEGEHELVVAQPDSDRKSTPVEILVTSDAPASTTSTSSTTTTSSTSSTTVPGETTTTVPGETTTSTTPIVSVSGQVTMPPVTVAPTAPPPTSPPTTRPAPAPIIDSSTLSGTVIHRLNCGYPDITVSARIQNAASATVIVEGTGFTRGMAKSGSSYSATIPSGIWGTGDVGTHWVTVRATGPGGVAEQAPGTIEIKMNCPKD
jgi:hypothetical protein